MDSSWSSVGLVLMVAVVLLVKDSPYRTTEVVKVKMRALARTLRSVWGNPGTRLGMWSHFTSQFSVTVFGMLWGYPFLVRGEGLSPRAAGLLLMVMTGWVVVSGLVMGSLVARFPFYRSRIVFGVVVAIATAWTAVLAWPGAAPVWLLVVLVCTIAVGGPASMVGFDLARTFTPAEASGRANGVVNIGGIEQRILSKDFVDVGVRDIDVIADGNRGFVSNSINVGIILYAGGLNEAAKP